jgi:hypothetical protein
MTTDSIEKVVVTGAGLTTSRLIWNRFQRPMPGLLGGIYDLNPGLADAGTADWHRGDDPCARRNKRRGSGANRYAVGLIK